MDGSQRQQRSFFGFPCSSQYPDALSLHSSMPLEFNDEDAWKALGFQSPQCLNPDRGILDSGLHTAHDDLCAYPPKCPSLGLFGFGGGGSGTTVDGSDAGFHQHMLFHSRHYPLAGGLGQPTADNVQFLMPVDSGSSGSPPKAAPGVYHQPFHHNDFAEQLSAVTTASPLQGAVPAGGGGCGHDGEHKDDGEGDGNDGEHKVDGEGVGNDGEHKADGEGDGNDGEDAEVADNESTCDSDCGVGDICHNTDCSDNPSVCCEDESCLQTWPVDYLPACQHGENAKALISSEDAIAAAALASFVGSHGQQPPPQQAQQQLPLRHQSQSQQQQHQSQAQQHQHQSQSQQHQHQSQAQQHQQHHQHQHTLLFHSSTGLGLGPDVCISPQFLTNYQHLREAHHPLQPSCTAPSCPIDDPRFYQECHVQHVLPPNSHSLFNDFDLGLMMAGNSHDGHIDDHTQCGAKLPSSEAMVQHFWNEHLRNLAYAFRPPPTQPQNASGGGGGGGIMGNGHHPHMTHSGLMSSVALSSPVSLSSLSPLSPLSPSTAGLMDPGMPGPWPRLTESSYTEHPSKKSKIHRKQQLSISSFTGGPGDAAAELLKHKEGPAASASAPSQSQSQEPSLHKCWWSASPGETPCGQEFELAGDLHTHVLRVHTQQLSRDVGGLYSCGWAGCTRRDGEEKGGFAQKSKIERHMQVHTGNKPFLCNICHQSFSANQALLQHKLIHEDSKPLSCEICGKTFRQHSALTMHIRTHTKVRPLKCPYCHKEFSESSNLSKHKRIHTGEGLYACDFPGCHKHFHRKDQLRRHSVRHSQEGYVSPSPLSAVVAEAAVAAVPAGLSLV